MCLVDTRVVEPRIFALVRAPSAEHILNQLQKFYKMSTQSVEWNCPRRQSTLGQEDEGYTYTHTFADIVITVSMAHQKWKINRNK